MDWEVWGESLGRAEGRREGVWGIGGRDIEVRGRVLHCEYGLISVVDKTFAPLEYSMRTLNNYQVSSVCLDTTW